MTEASKGTDSTTRAAIAELTSRALEFFRSDRIGEALEVIERGLALDQSHSGLLNNKGAFASRLGDLHTAEIAYRRAVDVQPPSPEACNNLGNLLMKANRPDEAEAAYRRAIAVRPDYANALNNLGTLLLAENRPREAEDNILAALKFNPNLAGAYVNLAAAYLHQKRNPEAEFACRRALELQPENAEAMANLGLALTNLDRLSEAEAAYKSALALDPGHQDNRWNLALLLLSQGRYAEGWKIYQVRLNAILDNPDFVLAIASPKRRSLPLWNGESLSGKSLLVWPEGGFGDEIQFIRYARLLKAKGLRHLTVACRPELKPLFEIQALADQVIAIDEWMPEMADGYDAWCPLLSLPMHLETTLETVPAVLPYLAANPVRLAHWATRIPAANLRVGLIWKGSREHPQDVERSLPSLATLAPLWSVQGISFVSLQKGNGEDEASSSPPEQALIHLGTDIADFGDTAAIIDLLDLVISVDTAGAHIAAAMGKTCWILLASTGTDWRWLRGRDDSPWYPNSVRLFRQDAGSSWSAVIDAVRQALCELKTRRQ